MVPKGKEEFKGLLFPWETKIADPHIANSVGVDSNLRRFEHASSALTLVQDGADRNLHPRDTRITRLTRGKRRMHPAVTDILPTLNT